MRFKNFRRLEVVVGIMLVSSLVSCGAIRDIIDATAENTPIVNYSDCWKSTTPFNGKYYIQRVAIARVESSNSNYLFKDILARVEVNQEGKRINNSKELVREDLFFIYSDPRDGASAFSETFVEIPYQLDSLSDEVLERGTMKYNLTSMTVQDDLSGQTYHMKPCDSFQK